MHPVEMHVTVAANASQHQASQTLCSLQLDSLTQQAAEAQQQADAAAAALAAAPAASRLAAAESAAAEAAQQAWLAVAKLEPLQHEVQSLQQERDALQQRLSSAQQQLTRAAQQQPGDHDTLTNGGASVADKVHKSADEDEPQLVPGTGEDSGTGVCLWCCALRILSVRVAQGLCACVRLSQNEWVQQDGELALWTPGCLLLQRRCSDCGKRMSGCRARRRRPTNVSLALLLCRWLQFVALDVSV